LNARKRSPGKADMPVIGANAKARVDRLDDRKRAGVAGVDA
jgi:hypothetical protein